MVSGEVAAVYEAAHHFDEAVDTALTTVEPIDGLLLSFSRRSYGHGAWLGMSEGRAHYLSDATLVGQGGATVDWLGIIPTFRNMRGVEPYSIWSHNRDITCRPATRQRNLIAQGEFKQALRVDSGACKDVEHVAHYELRGGTETTKWDDIQNFWRYTGDLRRASKVAADWARSTRDPLAIQRQGEIEYLRGNLSAAERFLQRATDERLIEKLTDDLQPFPDWTEESRLEARTMLGLTREKAGQVKAARSTYEETAAALRSWYEGEDETSSDCSCEAFAETRLGKLAATAGDDKAALLHFKRAAELVVEAGAAWTSGTEFNDYAAALLEADQSPRAALRYARLAVGRTPRALHTWKTCPRLKKLLGRPSKLQLHVQKSPLGTGPLSKH